MEEIARRFAVNAALQSTPVLKDHGVDQNVLHRVSGADFSAFHGQVVQAAPIARAALDESSKRRATEKWQRLFGEKFPLADEDREEPVGGSGGGFTQRKSGSNIGGGRYG